MGAGQAVDVNIAVPAALMLGAARALGIMVIFPIFSLFNIAGILRFGLAIGLSAPSLMVAYTFIMKGQVTYFDLSFLSVKEFVFGFVLGIGLGVPFWAAQATGDMTDVYRGANAANLFDQVNALETAPLGSLLMSIALMLFIGAGGLVDLISIFYMSFSFWPLLAAFPRLPEAPLVPMIQIFASIFKAGAVLASPFIIVAMTIELSFSYTARSARQLQLNDALPVFKNLAVLVVLVVYTMFIGSYFHETWTSGFTQVRSMLEVDLGKE
ncbi:EscT/YscT/HrcT family type III secretion system export apparatus protein [Agrobacterium larrymoorei]|uniref:EscT/YscT/HrcT family type III secretion system export apparatus protein n=1 Tax=Agrobacterium larrymoorei TaxID=160699 RepID=UPI001574C988|nr:flagellar biosynthetic protein FliR [Agrobacterium larrymoorei]NTJ41867.1 EscT/YscT/HrcT family type III secretion system export apparatus protein [Agrobacterium larrymoorei]